jgi:hypothetical protein
MRPDDGSSTRRGLVIAVNERVAALRRAADLVLGTAEPHAPRCPRPSDRFSGDAQSRMLWPGTRAGVGASRGRRGPACEAFGQRAYEPVPHRRLTRASAVGELSWGATSDRVPCVAWGSTLVSEVGSGHPYPPIQHHSRGCTEGSDLRQSRCITPHLSLPTQDAVTPDLAVVQ